MKQLITSLFLLPIVCFPQGPFVYWEYVINPINENQIQWDSSNTENFIWQYGYNDKPFFGSTINKILVTDTTNMYDSLIDASVDLVLTRPYSGSEVEEGTAYVLKFDHKIDTDTSEAGGFFEINVDNDSLTYFHNGDTLKTYWLKFFLHAGNTVNDPLGYQEGFWYEMVADNGDTITLPYDFNVPNFYHNIHGYHDTLFDEHVGFTGTYDNLETFYMEMFFSAGGVKTPDQDDTLIFRFHFKSDSTSNGKNGWAIKNIESGYAVHPTGSINESSKNKIHVYPNPANDIIYFNQVESKVSTFSKINIYNINGQLMEVKNYTSFLSVDISDYSSGIYFYSISDDDGIIQNGKFVKM